jgi:outer membrane protein OmpA-like peptidoglycan-associated protein
MYRPVLRRLAIALALFAIMAAGLGPVSAAQRGSKKKTPLPTRVWDPDSSVERPAKPEPKRLRSYVVLLAKPDGSVGAIDLQVAGETTTLSRAKQAVNFDDPSNPFEVTEAELEEALGDLLEAEPQSPIEFVVYFPSGSTELSDPSLEAWPKIVAAISARQVPEISLSGHTDSSGSAKFNEQLGPARARAIQAALVDAGLDPTLIALSSGDAEEAPSAETSDPELALDRKVVIRVR